ncbi:MAG TPA: sigma 54-interacting transcriptional regulator [Polyangia bacterium]|jgi:formate hydrogenlyase transcriptional activator|nr:sigma 54-interacting transcriptional regulator [Polyangia bacterium]
MDEPLRTELRATLNLLPAHAELYLAEGQRLAHTGSWAFNAGGFEYWSSELFRIHGIEPRDRAPTIAEYVALVHPEDRDAVEREMKKMLANNSAFDFTKRIVRPDGEIRHIRCVGMPAPSGRLFRGFVGTGMDVTEQEQLTEALRQSEENFRLVVDGIAALVVATTPESKVEFINQQVLEYFAKTREELKDRWPSEAVHPDDRDAACAGWMEAVQGGHPFEIDHRLRRHDGVYRWFRMRGRPSRDRQGRIVRWYSMLTDIDERKKAEQQLEGQEKELRQVLDLAPQLVTVYGPERERLYANLVALSYFGMSLDDWRGLPMGADTHPDDLERLKAPIARAFTEGSAFEMETRLRKHDGSYRWFLSRGTPVRDHRAKITRWHLGSTDIDDRKRSEERLQQENVALREEIDETSMFEEIVGASPALAAVLSRVSKVANSDSTVLITGETGTGKELIARAIHRRSGRSAGAFVAVNCAAIPRELITSELFGHEKGAFTGALQRRLGRFELADGGTLFLDEVGELSPEIQVILLRVLQEQEFERLGGTQPIKVDVRVIAATNRDLTAAIEAEAFRQDLFYRLNVFPLAMPPLRERREDIPLLVRYFIDRYARKAGKSIRRVNTRALSHLQSYPWPGNIRELQNVIERSVIVCDTDEFTVDESWLSTKPAIDSRLKLSSSITAHEKAIVEDALRATSGRVFGPSGAAARLGIPRSTLESRIRALKINKSRFRARPARPS